MGRRTKLNIARKLSRNGCARLDLPLLAHIPCLEREENVALPIPVERQREVVCLSASGHQVVLGTAGSGKTTMAILRAAFLSDPEMPQHGRTLLLTYNKALCAYIRTMAAPEQVAGRRR
jgi:hypothetical protein